ncbi:MAG: signal recognition particle-docking protein FtsY [Syntrophaceae bacterium]|nr:signal recognition particle-docking protein FtsY [Syntrophaceae bacterium]
MERRAGPEPDRVPPAGFSSSPRGPQSLKGAFMAEEKKGFFQRLKEGLFKTHQGMVSRIDQLISGKKKIDDLLLEELEETLITSDIGVKTTRQLLDKVSEKVKRKELEDGDHLKKALQEEMFLILRQQEKPLELSSARPFVIMGIGVNGTGKTTTLSKMAQKFKAEGKSVLLVAADTFRAAAIEQLEIWAQRVGCEVIRHKSGADPSAVVFDALRAGKARGVDIILVDTAGRLHTKVNLMEELKKVKRVMARELPDSPHEVLLVLDATTGQNAISQAKMFNRELGVTGIALTKLDGTAKGGILISISDELKIPIRYIGIGEKVDDLREFNARDFVDALF